MPSSGYLKKGLIALGVGLIIVAFLMDDAPEEDKSKKVSHAVPINTSHKAEGAAAREVIADIMAAGKPDTKAAYEQAKAFAEAGQDTDAYLMYFFAARHGHGPSALHLATQADPNVHADTAEPFQALKWYQVAEKAGMKEASSKLKQLKTWVANAADQGDINAQRLLLQWQP